MVKMSEWLLLLFVLAPSAALAQNSCLADALQNYTRLKNATMADAPSAAVLSPETIIGLRRMEENYCYRVAYCIVGDPKSGGSLKFLPPSFHPACATKLWKSTTQSLAIEANKFYK